jgi:hypothetical protein
MWPFDSKAKNKKAAKKFYRNLLKGLRCLRRVIIADKLRGTVRQAQSDVFAVIEDIGGRDGIESPTPAFSEPPTESPKWFEINGCR